jgi:hypothetical protein
MDQGCSSSRLIRAIRKGGYRRGRSGLVLPDPGIRWYRWLRCLWRLPGVRLAKTRNSQVEREWMPRACRMMSLPLHTGWQHHLQQRRPGQRT